MADEVKGLGYKVTVYDSVMDRTTEMIKLLTIAAVYAMLQGCVALNYVGEPSRHDKAKCAKQAQTLEAMQTCQRMSTPDQSWITDPFGNLQDVILGIDK